MNDLSLDALLLTAVRSQSPDEPTFDIVTIDAGDFDALIAAARAQSEGPADLWLTPEVTEDGEVIDIICRSPDASRLLTIAVHPDKVYITEPRPEGWRKQTLTRAQSPVSRPTGEEVAEMDRKLAEADDYQGGLNGISPEMLRRWRSSLSTLSAERDAMEGALKAWDNAERAMLEADELAERAEGEGWGNDPTGSMHASDAYRRAGLLLAEARGLRRDALQHKGETDEQG